MNSREIVETVNGSWMVRQKTTKGQVRSDFSYARDCMRQAEAALKANDLDELGVLALELSGAMGTLLQYVNDRGVNP